MTATGKTASIDSVNGEQDYNTAGTGTARPAAIAEQSGNVDKIRDILFGVQMREYDARFARLEETLLKESADLKESTKRRIDTLESYFMKEMDSLIGRLKTERDERVSAVKDVNADLKNTAESLIASIREAQDTAAEADRELRSHVLGESKNFMDEIRTNHDRVLTVLERRFQELQNSKTDRAALAELFNELALRLNHEFRVPETDS